MKAFEEHLKKFHDVRPISTDADWARLNWRAALEWALNHPNMQLPLIDPYELDFIKEELSE